MDVIRLRGLKAETVIGVHDWERKLPRTVTIDLDVAADAAKAAAHDRLADALDYHALAQVAGAFVAKSRVQLIETLAEQLAAELMARFGIGWLSLTVHKPGAVPSAQDVSVTIERGRR